MKFHHRCLITGLLLALLPTLGWAYQGPGGLMQNNLYRCELTDDGWLTYPATGSVAIWNTRVKLQIRVTPEDLTCQDASGEWKIKKLDIYVGNDPVPLKPNGTPDLDVFPYRVQYEEPAGQYALVLDLEEDMDFRWGQPYEALRLQNLCVHGVFVFVDRIRGKILSQRDVWMVDPEFEATGPESEALVSGLGKVRHIVVKGNANRERHNHVNGFLKQKILSHWGFATYEMAHPRRAHFIDSPVEGMTFQTPTHNGLTDESGAFDYFPGETVELSIGGIPIGSTLVDHKISPLDMFANSDLDDPRVINMARLLQSLDADATPQKGILITDTVAAAFTAAMAGIGLESINFSDDEMVEDIIQATITEARAMSETGLVAVSAEDAQAHLGKSTSSSMFRKRVSRTPELASAKAKLNIMGVWFPALKANGDPVDYTDETGTPAIPYYDEDGNLIRTATEAKPIIATFCDADPETGAHDVWAAVSRDDGHTWKRKNISRMADRSSFTLANGEPYYGYCKKPVFQVKGNKILIAWTSKFAKGGKPRYSIRACPDKDGDGVPDECETCAGSGENEKCGPDYPYDDPYVADDFWGVSGPQRSVDYTEQGYPEEGEVPYSAVWTCRGVIVTQAEIDRGGWWADKEVGDIVWFKPERLTSGRRDANQVFMGAADGAGFAITWQEDPKGLRPGEAKGPGPGWGGATANHKTDIWYSYITWADHAQLDENFVAGGDPEHPVQYDDEGNEIAWTNRPKALVPMSLPVRISDNDAVNTNNAELLDADGNPIAAVSAGDITYETANLTRCVKFEGGGTIVTPDDPDALSADYAVLRAVPSDHSSTMNCTNCHVPYDTDPHGENPTQAAPVPLVVVNDGAGEYLGGFTNSDCVSCHYNHVVPRDRVIAVSYGLDEAVKCAECEAMGGIWKDGTQEGGEIIEAYYPYDPYPYIQPDPDDTKDGSHRYITEVTMDNFPWLQQDLWSYENGISPDGIGLYTKTNYQGAERTVAVATDGRLLDGNTSATRPNLFLQTYTKKDGTKSAWAIMAYEETKGLGSGPSETTGTGEQPQDGSGYDPYESVPDNGKNAIYHSFDFTQPDLVSAGTILNLPETDEYGNPVYAQEPEYLGSDPIYDAEGNITGYEPIPNPLAGQQILDWKGDPILAYENARRPRFILQSKASAFGGTKTDGSFKQPDNSGTVLIVLYKEGEEGAGRPSDIMMRRCVVKNEDGTIKKGNPWSPANFLPGAQNVSTVMPGTTWINPDRSESAKGDGVKVCDWIQPEECLTWKSGVNPYEDARAHRGAIRGDFVIMGYSYCPNWAASRKAHDKYDFYIRRSFDGGATWTTDPDYDGDVTHIDYFFDPEGVSGAELDAEGNDVTEPTKHYTVDTVYQGGGVYEPARNVSLIKNNKVSVIEPRIVAVPGTIKVNGVWTGIAEDKQDPDVFYLAYGTSTNLPDVEKAPEDLFLSFSLDRGNTLVEDTWVVNPDSDGNHADETVSGWYRLAKGDQEQGEVQIRMTPNGERFYGVWLDEGEEGSDIMFRRLMPTEFPANVPATATGAETTVIIE